jgi:hypothetical protein
MKRAKHELGRYRHLLPADFALGRDGLKSRNEDERFGGW